MSIPKHSSGKKQSDYRSELFTIRMWREALNEHFEWRGKVIHSHSHKECYFRNWEALASFMQEALAEIEKQTSLHTQPEKSTKLES